MPVLATWDDHDYGLNDAGAEFPLKHVAQEAFLDFSPPQPGPRGRYRATRTPGIYHARTFGPVGRRVQVILLDTRFFRGPLTRNEHRPRGRGPYRPDPESASGMLGEAQWAWLDEQLRRPADLRVIASSIQVVADEHGWETWGNLPRERDRLVQLIDDTDAVGRGFCQRRPPPAGVVARRADRVCPIRCGTPPPRAWTPVDRRCPNPTGRAWGPVFRGTNFGVLRINWTADRPTLTL